MTKQIDKIKEELPAIEENVWYRPTRKGFIHECCSCGLRHKVDFKLVKIGNNTREILWKWNGI